MSYMSIISPTSLASYLHFLNEKWPLCLKGIVSHCLIFIVSGSWQSKEAMGIAPGSGLDLFLEYWLIQSPERNACVFWSKAVTWTCLCISLSLSLHIWWVIVKITWGNAFKTSDIKLVLSKHWLFFLKEWLLISKYNSISNSMFLNFLPTWRRLLGSHLGSHMPDPASLPGSV